MQQAFTLAILGATGLVGETLLDLLEGSSVGADQLVLLASERSAGRSYTFKGSAIIVRDVADFDFSKADFAIFSAGKEAAAHYAPIAIARGCTVVDNSSEFRYQDSIPLIIPEVNGYLLQQDLLGKIISNPNCSTIQMLVALKPIYDAVGIKTINVATYQAVSGQGKEAMAELMAQSQAVLAGREVLVRSFATQMAFNTLPEIDKPEANGYTREEMKMVWETQKIFSDPDLLVNPTAVRVPVFNGHSLALHIETKAPISVEQAHELLQQAEGIELVPYTQAGKFPTSAIDADGEEKVLVGRVRQHLATDQGLNLWVVADNLRKGAALNAWQIVQQLLRIKGDLV